MNTTEHLSVNPDDVWNKQPAAHEPPAASRRHVLACVLGSLRQFFNLQREPKSILRNQTNLPMFVLIAVGLSLLCNFTLRENTAEASRPVSAQGSIEKMRGLLRKSPDDYELHSQIADLYFREKNYQRAMFHLTESSRLIEYFGE